MPEVRVNHILRNGKHINDITGYVVRLNDGAYRELMNLTATKMKGDGRK